MLLRVERAQPQNLLALILKIFSKVYQSCSALLASLARSFALICLLPSSWRSSFCLCDEHVDFIQFHLTVHHRYCHRHYHRQSATAAFWVEMAWNRRVKCWAIHSSARSLLRSHCSLFCSLWYAHSLARLLTRSRTLEGGFVYEINVSKSCNFIPLCTAAIAIATTTASPPHLHSVEMAWNWRVEC